MKIALVTRRLDAGEFGVIHVATEGPPGSAARAHCRRRGWAFSTAFHTRFPGHPRQGPPRPAARAQALDFDWQRVCEQFVAYPVPSRTGSRTVTPLSQKLHKLAL